MSDEHACVAIVKGGMAKRTLRTERDRGGGEGQRMFAMWVRPLTCGGCGNVLRLGGDNDINNPTSSNKRNNQH